MVTTAQLSAIIGQKRAAPVQRPATAIRMPMKNMPSIEKGQKASNKAQPGWVRSLTPTPSAIVEPMASVNNPVSIRIAALATLPLPKALVRHNTRSRASTPSWKRPEPSEYAASPAAVCGSSPITAIAAAQATAPTLSSAPCLRKGRAATAPGAGTSTTRSERAGAGVWDRVMMMPPNVGADSAAGPMR